MVGFPSDRTVRRTIIEALLAAKLQLTQEMADAIGLVFGSDGTGHLALNYQSHHIVGTRPDGTWKMFFAGVFRQADHTAETQFQGWVKDVLQDRIDFFNSSPKATAGYVAIDSVAEVLRAVFSDHAPDQCHDT
ncbi:hypothetical protein EXIGLDRAFT_769723 [Exidia glandulosa HHB12029]|uniref:Uncharacterized protein n=1 Tax=Exidia glandulosa HHB12029 TaxID=1314781 RepID=A0A165H7Y6_EXIGL|nr:hypothetical protein EXIGLDRAFT_769723 [Exidia glandulosa HHB12029]